MSQPQSPIEVKADNDDTSSNLDESKSQSDSNAHESVIESELESKSNDNNKNNNENETIDIKATPPPTNNVSNEFSPSLIVLAKVKGYPAWPAMVLEESLLPINILNNKPKPHRNSSIKNPTTLVPVRFFSDDTYIWMKVNDLKKLGDEEISENLNKLNSRANLKKKEIKLQEAFQLAQNPLSMNDFVRWGSQGEPEYIPVPEEEEVEVEEDEEEEEVEVIEDDDDEDDNDEEFEEGPKKKKQKIEKKKPGPKPKGKPGPKAKAKGKPGPKAKAKPVAKGKPGPKPKSKPEPVAKKEKVEVEKDPYDSDWGLDEVVQYNYEEGNYIFEDEEEQIEFSSQFPKLIIINDELNKKVDSLNKLNDTLTNQLITIVKDEEENKTPEQQEATQPQHLQEEDKILKNLNKLKNLIKDDLPKSIFLKSSIYKIMIIILHKPIESFTYENIRQSISKILNKYLDLTIDPITLDEFEKQSQSQTQTGQITSELTPVPYSNVTHESNGNGHVYEQNGTSESNAVVV